MNRSSNPQKIAIWGYAREGKASHAYLLAKYPSAEFTIIDKTMPNEQANIQKMTEGYFDVVVKSPGISLYKPEVTAAKEKGTIFTSGTNLWFEQYPHVKTIGITGSKGKSTTTSLVYHALKKKGLDVALAGNIGLPLLDVTPPSDGVVIEMSSYQIADLNASPSVAAVLNIYPAHGDWHGSDAQYFNDKMRLIDVCARKPVIVRRDDPHLFEKTKNMGNVIYFSEDDDVPALPPQLSAPHLKLNVMAAIKICTAFGVNGPWDGVWDDFKPLAHRQEQIGIKNGVLYVNDSIATIPESTIAALEVFKDKPIYLLLGGQEKMQDETALIEKITSIKNIHVLTLPDNGKRYGDILQGKNVPVTFCQNVTDAVEKAQNLAMAGSVILLSPAAPSYGHFKNFEERGDLFKKLSGF